MTAGDDTTIVNGIVFRHSRLCAALPQSLEGITTSDALASRFYGMARSAQPCSVRDMVLGLFLSLMLPPSSYPIPSRAKNRHKSAVLPNSLPVSIRTL
eukprot:COSAG02_NODE_315_length_24910_cov_17.139978_9_plen_98_part_00